MKTRHAEEGSAFRQERYMSAVELERGLLANCVASRLRVVDDAEQRKLIWWLQLVSQEPGGMERVARMIVELWPARIATRAMQALGLGARRTYSAKEVLAVRTQMPLRVSEEFLLEGELTCQELLTAEVDWTRGAADRKRSDARPISYPAGAFVERCQRAAREELAEYLFKELCLNPAVKFSESGLWYLPDLLGALRDCHAAWIAEKADACAVTTSVGAAVEETLDYGLTLRGAGQSIVVIDGLARIGKTFAVKQWAARHPGEARYVQVPSTNDEISFFRAISAALGLAHGTAFKSTQLRDRVEDVLSGGDLMLVLDEGHYCFPVRNQRKSMPHRINWILTQLVNMGVPVAIVTTPQFTKSQEALVKHGGWSSEQLIGRVAHYETLPDSIPAEELREVSRTFLPLADAGTLQLLVEYAKASEKYLAGIEALARRARHVAAKAGRTEPTLSDVKTALQGSLVPSDNALFAAVAKPQRAATASAASRPLQARGNAAAIAPAPRFEIEPLQVTSQ